MVQNTQEVARERHGATGHCFWPRQGAAGETRGGEVLREDGDDRMTTGDGVTALQLRRAEQDGGPPFPWSKIPTLEMPVVPMGIRSRY